MTDMDKLIAAVEAGEPIRIGLLPDSMPHAWQHIYSAADGSLDAALRLHEALLPGMFWNMGHLDQPSLGYVCTVADGHFADSPSWRGYAMTPARSWLLAILRAVKARGEP